MKSIDLSNLTVKLYIELSNCCFVPVKLSHYCCKLKRSPPIRFTGEPSNCAEESWGWNHFSFLFLLFFLLVIKHANHIRWRGALRTSVWKLHWFFRNNRKGMTPLWKIHQRTDGCVAGRAALALRLMLRLWLRSFSASIVLSFFQRSPSGSRRVFVSKADGENIVDIKLFLFKGIVVTRWSSHHSK